MTQSIVPSSVSPLIAEAFMLVWRAGACSHDGLTYQALLPCSLGCRAFQVLAACNAQLIRVLRHCSAETGPLRGARCVLPVHRVALASS